MEARFACGSMVRFYLFHKKIHFVNFFVKKHVVFRPAGGKASVRVWHADETVCTAYLVLLTRLTRCAIKRAVLPDGSPIRPDGGAIRHQIRDRLLHVSIGRFAVFAHVVVFVVQTPTAA